MGPWRLSPGTLGLGLMGPQRLSPGTKGPGGYRQGPRALAAIAGDQGAQRLSPGTWGPGLMRPRAGSQGTGYSNWVKRLLSQAFLRPDASSFHLWARVAQIHDDFMNFHEVV